MTRDHIIVIYLVGFLFGLRILAGMLWGKFRASRYFRPWMGVVLGFLVFSVWVILSEGRPQ